MKGIPHRWDLSPAEAILLQRELAGQVDRRTPLDLDYLHLVAGVDVSVKGGVSRAAIVVLRFPELTPLETVRAEMPTPLPYIPGLLSFREGAVILEAHAKLTHHPDAYIVDGQGIAHPRRLGIASHMGLWLDAPTVGCAKSRLTGSPRIEPPPDRTLSPEPVELHPRRTLSLSKGDPYPLDQAQGSQLLLYDQDEIVGAVLRTRSNVKPVYISIGHRATLESAVELVLRCVTRYRLPEPIRAAHRAAGIASPQG